MTGQSPVTDWTNDWDHHDPAWVENPYPIWNEMRDRCPMGHTDRYNDGAWLPLTAAQLQQIAHDTDSFSSVHDGLNAGGSYDRMKFPPIHSDPPEHRELRRAILPFFSPKMMDRWEPRIRTHCREMAAEIAQKGAGDAAVGYSQHIPVDAIAAILGVRPERGEEFRRWTVDFVEVGAQDKTVQAKAAAEIAAFMQENIESRRADPTDDLISHLVHLELDGQPLTDDVISRMLVLQLIAGIDTTWSSIGAALWHLATHPEDRQRLVDEPELIPTAVEEFLRAYAPVNVVRKVVAETEVDGLTIKPGDTVMMTFPIGCRDPDQFDHPDEVVIDRQQNRHMAFGLGIHRCAGSNLARLEMHIAIEEFLAVIPDFSLAPDAVVRWSEGQIRGPRTIPIVVGG